MNRKPQASGLLATELFPVSLTCSPTLLLPCSTAFGSRGNKIPIELFCHAVKGWGRDTRRLVMAA